MPTPTTFRLIAAFAAVYLIWGSTYLAILFAIETIPPFFMAAMRFLTAGVLLYVWQRSRGGPKPEPVHWRTAFILGGLLLVGGNGSVVWAEQFVPSGLAALLVATEPLWIVMLVWLLGKEKLTGRIVVGLLMGFAGVAVLVGPGRLAGGDRVDPVGALVLMFAALSWATGSLYSREAPQPSSQQLASAITMLAGGLLFLVVSAITGEFARVDIAAISLKSALATLYLAIFGSLVAFSAYLWLMKATTPARASTYAYVNPVVAVILGWLLAAEPLTPRVMIAATIVVSSVALIVSKQAQVEAAAPEPLEAAGAGHHTGETAIPAGGEDASGMAVPDGET